MVTETKVTQNNKIKQVVLFLSFKLFNANELCLFDCLFCHQLHYPNGENLILFNSIPHTL